MTTMAEVIAATTGCELVHAESVATSLTNRGFGHVPTALNEAADALGREAGMVAADTRSLMLHGFVRGVEKSETILRARAAETGATP